MNDIRPPKNIVDSKILWWEGDGVIEIAIKHGLGLPIVEDKTHSRDFSEGRGLDLDTHHPEVA